MDILILHGQFIMKKGTPAYKLKPRWSIIPRRKPDETGVHMGTLYPIVDHSFPNTLKLTHISCKAGCTEGNIHQYQ